LVYKPCHIPSAIKFHNFHLDPLNFTEYSIVHWYCPYNIIELFKINCYSILELWVISQQQRISISCNQLSWESTPLACLNSRLLKLYMMLMLTRLTRRLSLVEQELLTLPENPSSHPVISGIRVTRSLILCVCFVDRCLSLFFWPLCCLSFDLRILITLLVSSNSF